MPLSKCDLKDFDYLVNLDIETKILIAKSKIKEAKETADKKNCPIYVSFSGGKDSIVVSDLILETIGVIPHISSDTRIEFPGVKFIKEYCENRNIPSIIKRVEGNSMPEIIKKHGYPLLSKSLAAKIERAQIGNGQVDRKIAKYHKVIKEKKIKLSAKCCNYFRKGVLRELEGVQFTGIRAPESFYRKMIWAQKSCYYNISEKVSYMTPIIFFKDSDVRKYIENKNIKIPIQYHLGWERTGCWPCGFAAPFMRPNNFQLLRIWYPKRWNGLMHKWGYREACEAVFITTGHELSQVLINDFRKEKLINLTDRRYKEEISALIDRAEIDEKSYNFINEK